MNNKYVIEKNFRKAVVTVLAIIYVAQQFLLIAMNRGSQVMILGGTVSISGILSAVQFIVAIAMTLIDYKTGGTLAQIFLILSSISAFGAAVVSGNYASLPGVFYFVASAIAIILIKLEMSKVNKISNTDHLTNISNRRNILDLISLYIGKKTPFYLLYLDLDHFKYINDQYGHAKGDLLLKAIVKEWEKIDPKNNIIGRIGGDEFLAIVPESVADDVEIVAYEYLKAIKSLPSDISAYALYITVSVGIVKFPVDGNNADELVKKADIAMFSAKNAGRNTWCIYDENLDREILREQHIEMRIRDALVNGLFHMVYQPQFSISDKKLRGYEALLRMDSYDGETISPAEFIPVAERSELIISIGEFVLKRATKDFSNIVKENPNCVLSVNISAKQILTGDFVGAITKILSENDFPAKNLEIEITEYCMMDSTNEAVEVIKAIKKLGVKLAMDDFGTGYSSLSYLTKLPIDLIKIDKSIIDTIDDGEIVRAISSMGHALSCEIIAEGVEEQDQLEILRRTGCDFVQGFLWGRPVPLEDAKQIILKKDA